MPEKERDSQNWGETDFAKVDAHEITPEEYEEIPELTEEFLATARYYRGGRPVSPNPRKLISLRLPADVIARWRATGPGWQTRMAEVLTLAIAGPAPEQPATAGS